MNRRHLLVGGLAGLLVGPARAQDAPPVLGGRWRAAPDFSRLMPEPLLVGVRPHRKGGVRLEVEALGPKRVVHDYGHGGAGITLAWGCAEQVADEVGQIGGDGPIAMIGAGVAGLCAATVLRRRWPARPLTIYAAEIDVTRTTSWVAGGQFEPSGIWREYGTPERREVLHGWLRRSRAGLEALAPRFGVLARDNFTLDHEVGALDELPVDVMPAAQRGLLPFTRLTAPGRMVRTLLADPTRLLPALAEDLRASGVGFVRRRFAARAELLALAEPVIVHATGLGARALFDDTQLVPQRGHLMRLERTLPEQDWLFGGGCQNRVIAYAFCRHDDIVLGGTWIPGDDRDERLPEDLAIGREVLANVEALFGGRPDACRTPG